MIDFAVLSFITFINTRKTF